VLGRSGLPGGQAQIDNGETTMVIGQALDEVWQKAIQQHTYTTHHAYTQTP